MVTALVLLVAGAVLALVAVNLPWGRAYLDGGGTILVPGRAVAPNSLALPLFAFAASIAVLATRLGRILIGAILAVGAFVAGYSALWWGFLSDRVRDWALAAGHDVVGVTGGSAELNWYLVACAVIFVAGVWIAVRGPRWPTLSRRYERGTARDEPAERSTPQHAWDALDRGEDPTA
jgi:uncharacterized membrane protein (TIGR02234 family)